MLQSFLCKIKDYRRQQALAQAPGGDAQNGQGPPAVRHTPFKVCDFTVLRN